MPNDMRDRLRDLISNSHCVETWDYYNDEPMKPCPIEKLADYLIANGVILPPCKVGDKVYLVCRNRNTMEWYISEENAYSISAYNNGIEIYITPIVSFTEMEIGVRLFLTKEEAEAKIKENVKNG